MAEASACQDRRTLAERSPGESVAGYHAGMPDTNLLTPSKIAAELKIPDAKVKKAIAELGLAPAARKGVCSYYDRSALPKIKKALK